MGAFDPRAETGIPTEPCGSLPRSQKLQAAYASYDAGEIDKAMLEAEQDAAVKDSIERFEETGSPIVTDGEQRWSSFATYPMMATMSGTGLNPSLAPGGQTFALFPDMH
jgi:methionine synthase II (cobalamin-independent)